MTSELERGATRVALVVAAGIWVGCGSVVSLPEEDGTSTGGWASSGPGPSSGSGPACEPSSGQLQVVSPTSGTFIEGVLHLAATVDGQPRYLVAEVQGGAGYVVEMHDELLGPATLAPVSGEWFARLRVDGSGSWIDVISVSAGRNPSIIQVVEIDGQVPAQWQSVFTVADQRLITCVRRSPGEDLLLGAVDITGSVHTLAEGKSQPCSEWYPDTAGMAFDGTWVEWRTGANGELGGWLKVIDVGSEPIQDVADYNYSPDGVHAYGSVVSVATDGTRVVFDIGNDSRFFIHDPSTGIPTVTHAWFGLDGPKKLVGVIGGNAYLANASGVRLFDVSQIPDDVPTDDWPAPLRAEHADVRFGDDLPRHLASNDEHLLLVDGQGLAYLVPAHPDGPVAPMRFYLGEPPAAQPGCD